MIHFLICHKSQQRYSGVCDCNIKKMKKRKGVLLLLKDPILTARILEFYAMNYHKIIKENTWLQSFWFLWEGVIWFAIFSTVMCMSWLTANREMYSSTNTQNQSHNLILWSVFTWSFVTLVEHLFIHFLNIIPSLSCFTVFYILYNGPFFC